MDKKGLDYDGFRSLAVWLMDKIKGLWNGKAQEFTNILDTIKSQYAGAVYLSQEEYDALTDEQKNDTTKVYFIEEQL